MTITQDASTITIERPYGRNRVSISLKLDGTEGKLTLDPGTPPVGTATSAREDECAAERQTLPAGDPKTQAEAMDIAGKSINKTIDLAGFAFLEMPLPHNEAPDLKSFADASHVIVSGVIGNRRGSVTADDRWVVSAYTFKVDEVFKGSVAVGQELIALVLGGAVTFEDGTWAQVVFDRFVTPTAGERYGL